MKTSEEILEQLCSKLKHDLSISPAFNDVLDRVFNSKRPQSVFLERLETIIEKVQTPKLDLIESMKQTNDNCVS